MPRSRSKLISCEAGAPMRDGTVGGLMGFCELVAALGGDPRRIVVAGGLTCETMDNPDNVIPFAVGARLLHLAAAETGCPHFGLLLGQRQDLTLLGPIGFLMQHSPDVQSALANLVRFMHVHVRGASARVAVRGRVAEFSYHIHIPGVVGAEQVYAISMANRFRFMQILCGKDWLPTAVHFNFRAPPDEGPYRDFFRAPVRFSQSSSALLFSAHDLERKIVAADPALAEILHKYVSQIESRHSGDFLGQLRSVIGTLLPTGNCTAERVAGLFSMHRRTLHRVLASHGTTFETLMDVMRRRIAEETLERSDMKFAQLADMLGYKGVSSFNRAFRRWTDMSPSDWRSARQ